MQELARGDHFDYAHPPLPTAQAQAPLYRFAPLEHPTIVLDEKHFETTGLEDMQEDPSWIPDAERIVSASYQQVASNVLLDRAKTAINERNLKEDIAGLCRKGIELWPENREGWALLWEIGSVKNDAALRDVAKDRYHEIGGDDTRFYFNSYRMTGDRHALATSLERYPAYVQAFVEKGVVLEEEPQEARFNFAVASWCVANSSALRLDRFYSEHQEDMKKLFGEEKTRQLLPRNN